MGETDDAGGAEPVVRVEAVAAMSPTVAATRTTSDVGDEGGAEPSLA